jgi:hypothetical protein
LIEPFGLRVGQASREAMPGPRGNKLGATMNDLLVIGMTIFIFALLFVLVRVVEHIER